MRRKFRSGVQVFFTLCCMAAVAACDGSNTYVPPPPPKVQVALPLQRTVTQYFELTGNTAAYNSVDIEARVQGFLESINYQDGAMVTKGTELFGIQRNTYEAQVEQSKASLASAQASQVGAKQEFDRQTNLVKQGVSTQSLYDTAQANLDEANAAILNAQASLDLANINLGYTTVTAPFDGIVTDHLADIGALVGVSGPTKLATIVQTAPLYAYFNVSESQVLMIKESLEKSGHKLTRSDFPNIPVEIGLQTEEGYPHKGHLDYVSPQVDASSGTLMVRGLFDNAKHELLPGLFVRIRVPIGHTDNALLVPDDAIGVNQQGSYVLVLGKDDVIEQRQVKTAQRDGPLRVIESGLEPTDWVVALGIQRAIPGNKVAPERIELQDGSAGSASTDDAEKPEAE
ncbi:efflux RND transporter periplasmic adaptor subunit [Rhizobium sp. BK251]|uniref:efflux RND transporter periplasmic adaptor subunit n=1 Tax=Rhizobium sp. BK251 TaxID=2512125 RepID=UPI0010455A1E|nr:efflux RND transporter periplasmic adaptor subunit [Rhizobium sp. BK251]TCL69490.1 RND family efflux transporter MFP subunit [Rhizobium sp. BK251]